MQPDRDATPRLSINDTTLREGEQLIRAMEPCGRVQAKAARLLRVTPRQLGYALHKNRIEVRKC